MAAIKKSSVLCHSVEENEGESYWLAHWTGNPESSVHPIFPASLFSIYLQSIEIIYPYLKGVVIETFLTENRAVQVIVRLHEKKMCRLIMVCICKYRCS